LHEEIKQNENEITYLRRQRNEEEYIYPEDTEQQLESGNLLEEVGLSPETSIFWPGLYNSKPNLRPPEGF
jgi:hypothetical protein